MAFRRIVPDDVEQCLELYRLNEPGRFPEGMLKSYWKALLKERAYFLVLPGQGQLIATGGIQYVGRPPHSAFLVYGLVHPQHQGQGVGTALLLSRLALLNDRRWWWVVTIFAVEDSVGFYHRFGFRPAGPWKDKSGAWHPIAQVMILSYEIRRIREILRRHGVTYPQEDADVIPSVNPHRLDMPNDQDDDAP
jgi:ribosomal-protein-alanine N-acetyltransferase